MVRNGVERERDGPKWSREREMVRNGVERERDGPKWRGRERRQDKAVC